MVIKISNHVSVVDKVYKMMQLTGWAVHSQQCCQDQADEPFHLNGTGGKILDLSQQHGERNQQAFSEGTATYGM